MTLNSEFFKPDVVRIDVTARDLPPHFLGTAFDLTLPGEWQFDHYELCGIFSGKNQNILQIVSPQPLTRRIVFGLAVAGGGYDDPSDGCLARFYFHLKQTQTLKISFEHARMSVYQNGRRDLADVRWEGGFLNAPQDNPQALVTRQPADIQSTQEFTPQTVRSLQTDFLKSLSDPSLASVYMVILIALGLALAVFAGILAYFRFRRKK